MRIYVINLDRHSLRWDRLKELLQGLDFQRIAAVDGKTIDGPELRDRSIPLCHEALSRYERACVLSHRAAWLEFLAGKDPYCCILEDDVIISPDFTRFIKRENWIPKRCEVLKIETCTTEFYFSRKTIACLDRRLVVPHSLHLGCAAYIISRRSAQILLEETVRPDRPIDRIMFDETGLQKLRPVYQLFPALCIQANRYQGGILFPELDSSIERTFTPEVQTQIVQPRKHWPTKSNASWSARSIN
ncbi:MAG: glycosyltransferase family 25 protein [Limisphaerales bacterium]